MDDNNIIDEVLDILDLLLEENNINKDNKEEKDAFIEKCMKAYEEISCINSFNDCYIKDNIVDLDKYRIYKIKLIEGEI